MEEIKNVFFDFCTNIRNGVATFETEEDNINQIIEFCSEVSAEVKNNNLESVKKTGLFN